MEPVSARAGVDWIMRGEGREWRHRNGTSRRAWKSGWGNAACSGWIEPVARTELEPRIEPVPADETFLGEKRESGDEDHFKRGDLE